MAGWNTTDFNWESLPTFYNAPPGMLLNDLLAAATERWSTLSDTEISNSSVGDNAPLSVNAYNDIFTSLVWGDGSNRFIRPASATSYDYTNEPDIFYWDRASLVSELGAIPEHTKAGTSPPFFFPEYESNAPLTAEWCQWWYKAIKLLVRVEYRIGGLMSTMLTSDKEHDGASETYAEAKSAWAAEPWSTPAPSVGEASQSARLNVFGGFNLQRFRGITDQATYQWKPHLYTGNYTLSAWGRFGALPFWVYDNPDYPCAVNTYAKIFDDASVQSEVYDKDIEFGYFDTITASEPENFDTRFWSSSGTLRNHCRFDISGGFEYV